MTETIRLAVPAEATALWQLTQDAYAAYVPVIGRRPAPMDDDFAARIAAGQAWVLERAEGIAGLAIVEQEDDHLWLDNIAVAPALAGQGLGRVLLDFVEAEARRLGRPQVRLLTHVKMVRNIAIYAGRGYVETGRAIQAGFDRVFMAKQL